MSGNSSSDKAADELNRRWRAVAPRVVLFVLVNRRRKQASGVQERKRRARERAGGNYYRKNSYPYCFSFVNAFGLIVN